MAPVVGLSAGEIERFAREYATTQPSRLRPLIGLEYHKNGAMQFRALACLPVLSGAWRHRGGGLARSTHALQFGVLDMNRVEMPEVHKHGVRTHCHESGCVMQNIGVGHPAINHDSFTPQEQLDLLEQIWASLSQHPERVPLTDAQAGELDRRLDDLEDDIREGRSLGEPWDEVRKRLNLPR